MIHSKNRLYIKIRPLGLGWAVPGSCLVLGRSTRGLGARPKIRAVPWVATLAQHGSAGDCRAGPCQPVAKSTDQAWFFRAEPMLGLARPPIFTPLESRHTHHWQHLFGFLLFSFLNNNLHFYFGLICYLGCIHLLVQFD